MRPRVSTPEQHMKIDTTNPVVEPVSDGRDAIQIQAENRRVIQAVRAVNASERLGDSNELTFSLDRRTRRTIVKIVNRDTNEVVEQIPTEQVLRLAEDLK
jgi:flagellar protein FlaG